MFAAMGLSAVVPVIHGLRLYGYEQMVSLIGLPWLVLQGVLYVVGAAIYAVSPRTFPRSMTTFLIHSQGSNTRALQSRSIRFKGQLASDLPLSGLAGRSVTSCGAAEGVRFPQENLAAPFVLYHRCKSLKLH